MLRPVPQGYLSSPSVSPGEATHVTFQIDGAQKHQLL